MANTSYPTLRQLLEAHFDPDFADGDMEQFEECADLILNQAKPWLEAIGGVEGLAHFKLYRGLRNSAAPSDNEVYQLNTRSSGARAPTAMEPHVKDAWQTYIKNAGKVADRENSLLCTGDSTHADTFGKVAVIIPLDQFNYTWVEGIDDLNNWWWYAKGGDAFMFGPDTPDSEVRQLEQQRMQFLNGDYDLKIKGDDGTLRRAIAERAEIMLHIQNRRYLAIHPDHYDELIRMMVAQ